MGGCVGWVGGGGGFFSGMNFSHSKYALLLNFITPKCRSLIDCMRSCFTRDVTLHSEWTKILHQLGTNHRGNDSNKLNLPKAGSFRSKLTYRFNYLVFEKNSFNCIEQVVCNCSVTRLGNFCTLGNHSKLVATTILHKLPTLLGNFCKGCQNYSFSSEIIFVQLL